MQIAEFEVCITALSIVRALSWPTLWCHFLMLGFHSSSTMNDCTSHNSPFKWRDIRAFLPHGPNYEYALWIKFIIVLYIQRTYTSKLQQCSWNTWYCSHAYFHWSSIPPRSVTRIAYYYYAYNLSSFEKRLLISQLLWGQNVSRVKSGLTFADVTL